MSLVPSCQEKVQKVQYVFSTLMIGDNTNIGRRNPQPFELIELIEPFEPNLPNLPNPLNLN